MSNKKNLTGDYASKNKEDLQAEVDFRGIGPVTGTGANGAVVKDDLVNALTLDDEATGSDPRQQTEEGASHKAIATSDGMTARQVPHDLDDYKGRYRRVGDESGEVFGLKVLPDHEVRAHRTHHAKSPLHFWDGTAYEFRAQFDKA